MPIRTDPDRRLVALDTDATTYAFAVDPAGLLRHLYWGPRLDRLADVEAPALWEVSTNDSVAEITHEEYPIHGGLRFKETALAVRFEDGSRGARLVVTGIAVDAEAQEVVVALLDAPRGLTVQVHYRVLPGLDLIERWAVVRNEPSEAGREAGVIAVTAAASAQFHVPRAGLTLRNVFGHWGAEQQPFTQQVGPAALVLESRRGISSHHHNPYVVLDADASEDAGEVWCAALAWSGNFRATVAQTPYGDTLVQLGLNPWDAEVTLAPGESLTTPRVVAGYTAQGLTGISHHLHAYGHGLLDPRPRPVLYNSWEATGFEVDLEGQLALAQRAAGIGVELFVMDDGWFGRRSSIDDGLGDWWVDPGAFPDGLGPLIAQVHELGMDFGLWVEPEMVNPASDLYAKHPDWIYRDQVHDPDTARGQYVLDLTRPEVQEHLFAVLDLLLRENDIAYLKWDANRPMSAVGAHRDAHRAHIEALYTLVTRLKGTHPGVMIEACASGGGRIDLGALGVFDDVWTSDNTDAADRLVMQRAYSLIYPAKAMRAWITESPNFLSQRSIPLDFRARSAMMGTLGVGTDLMRADDAELKALAAHIATYKRLRPTIQDGRVYRLDNETGNDYQFTGYVREDRGQALLFAFLQASRVGHRKPTVRLRGLDPAATYRYAVNGVPHEHSGAYLMGHGVPLWLMGDYDSALVEFDRT